MNWMHDSGRVPSPFWAFFFLPIKWGGWPGCSRKALPTTAYCSSGTPVSWSLVTILVLRFQRHCLKASHNGITSCCVLRQVTLPLWAANSYLWSDAITSVSHLDARMSTCTYSRFLPKGFFFLSHMRTWEEVKAATFGKLESKWTKGKRLSRKKESF